MDESVPETYGQPWKTAGKRLLCLVVGLGMIASLGGCTRAFYRKAADREVEDILKEKDQYPAWRIEQFHVYPDPRARFADPTNPDRPPMPPDDPAAWNLGPHPQQPGHAGVGMVEGTGYLEMIKVWDGQNREARQAELKKTEDEARSGDRAPALEARTGDRATAPARSGDCAAAPPGERASAPSGDRAATGNAQAGSDSTGTPDQKAAEGLLSSTGNKSIQAYFDEPLTARRRGFLLTLPQTVELGLVNSPTYQRFREDLYLGALPVTQQRFSFAYQWAAVENAIRQWAGPQSSQGPQNNWTFGTNVGFTKLFSTGALLTLAFANTTVINFNNLVGPRVNTQSKINLDLVQPLLQGGGKAVTLEPLTEAERNLLYEIRAFARFREQFYVSVAIGLSLPSDLPSAAGATTVGSPISVLAALGIASTDVSGGFVGYLSTLFREVDEAVDRRYLHDLENALKLFEGLQEGGIVAPIQVQQVNSTMLNARNTVASDTQFVTNALDQFKLVLGLPANLPLILDDSAARPITRVLDRYYEVLDNSDAAAKLLERQEDMPPEKVRPFLLEQYTTHPLVRGTEFRKKLPVSWQTWAKATDQEISQRLAKLAKARRDLLDRKTDREMQGQQLTPNEAKSLQDADFEADVGRLEQLLRRYEARPWEKIQNDVLRRQDRLKMFRLVAYDAEIVAVWARNERFEQVGTMWPELPNAPLDDRMDLSTADVDAAQEAAVQAALVSRWDLMNARAQVTDAWRQLRVRANALLGVLNVTYHLDSQTPPVGTNPWAFSTSRTNSELILNGALPLVRVAERNAYRTAIIVYQRARRNLMVLEDNIAAQVRFDVRQLQLFGGNYKIQKRILESLYSQVENALEVIAAPVDPDQLKSTGTAGQANAAALTSQYLSALSGLNSAQTKMYDIWLSYLATRMQLYLDLERLPLDNRGVWIDESGKNADLSGRAGGGACFGEPCVADPGSVPAANQQRHDNGDLPPPRVLPPPPPQPAPNQAP